MQVRLTFSFLVLPAGQLSTSHAITSNTNIVMLAHEYIIDYEMMHRSDFLSIQHCYTPPYASDALTLCRIVACALQHAACQLY
jgi:hypothetical protein